MLVKEILYEMNKENMYAIQMILYLKTRGEKVICEYKKIVW